MSTFSKTGYKNNLYIAKVEVYRVKLIKFRLQNYKRYNDTGWISVDKLDAFVGKNESGKSALFQGLAKLNSSDGTVYNEFKELPRRLLTKLRGKGAPVCSACFELDGEEKKFVKSSYRQQQYQRVEITRNYNNEYSMLLDGKKEVNQQLSEYFRSRMPQFLYFDNYDVLDSTINIPDYLDKLQNDPNNRRLRVQNCLFKHVELTADKLRELDPSREGVSDIQGEEFSKERSALCNAAQDVMTRKFAEWWLQRRHKFHYKVDSKFFHIEVSDDIDPSPIELEERSMGMRYFFSFYLIFLVEAESTHKNSIILLDEPGLHYHGGMQVKLIEFFKNLSEKNQILYSTHSPFLIDSANLDSIKTVFEDQETGFSCVAETQNWPRDQEALFPIRVGWWYDVLNSYITQKTHLILEGPIDVDLFNTMNRVLEKRHKETLSSDILCVPGNGNKTSSLVSLLKALDVRMILFQDGDDAGTKRGKDIKSNHGISYCTTSEFCEMPNSTIEDLFPPDFYFDAVKKTYPDLNVENHIVSGQSATNILKTISQESSTELNKLKISQCLIAEIDKVPESSVLTFEKIFSKINQINADTPPSIIS